MTPEVYTRSRRATGIALWSMRTHALGTEGRVRRGGRLCICQGKKLDKLPRTEEKEAVLGHVSGLGPTALPARSVLSGAAEKVIAKIPATPNAAAHGKLRPGSANAPRREEISGLQFSR